MGTLTASGASTARSTAAAAREAAEQALAELGDRKAGFGFLFCSPKHDLATALRTVRQETRGPMFSAARRPARSPSAAALTTA